MMPLIQNSMIGSRKKNPELEDRSSRPVVLKKVRRNKRKTLYIEPMSFDQAKEQVSGYLQKNQHRTVWTSELNEKLHVDLGLLIKVLNELHKEGHIEKGE